ncbi:hypothetical protein I6J22_09090 [Corynebacterium kroppenstedtii]|uniref:Uncharacterized protein n=1 Tax=Corynebacterium kroppenstedtii (strain DSM 44385 / JCM 11950 / CIP 105744 / CCUG 35717) TaxID=645127 RepID=C4LKG2_CORK4|nr:hypothetical protein [Corynebacterium kroppenstedtii]ACR18317.1 hypothetical protein ckrop_1589 [Corynebacterium kroppenstedtii DSM 44385]QRP10340.1 hypothetical protein I6J22_09090 [Corynebacterium kroppenstedtii]
MCHREDAGVDAFGNATRSWGAPESVRVAGWFIDSSDEHGPDDRDVRRVDWAGSLLALPGCVCAGDRVELGGAWFLVADGGQDYTHGPWWDPGVVEHKLHVFEEA